MYLHLLAAGRHLEADRTPIQMGAVGPSYNSVTRWEATASFYQKDSNKCCAKTIDRIFMSCILPIPVHVKESNKTIISSNASSSSTFHQLQYNAAVPSNHVPMRQSPAPAWPAILKVT